MQLLNARFIEIHGISQHGKNNIILRELKILGKLYGRQKIAYALYAQKGQSIDKSVLETEVRKVMLTGRFVKKPDEIHAVFVIHRDHQIRVFHIVNPGNVLVSDTFNPMRAEAVAEKCRALKRLYGDDFYLGK